MELPLVGLNSQDYGHSIVGRLEESSFTQACPNMEVYEAGESQSFVNNELVLMIQASVQLEGLAFEASFSEPEPADLYSPLNLTVSEDHRVC